jgi:hypothetical protein
LGMKHLDACATKDQTRDYGQCNRVLSPHQFLLLPPPMIRQIRVALAARTCSILEIQ